MSTPENTDTQVPKNNDSGDLKTEDSFEKRYKDLQASYTQSQQELSKTKAEISVLKEVAKPTLNLEQSVKDELDELKFSDPDAWRKKLDSLEAESVSAHNNKIAEAVTTVTQEDELSRRVQVLSEFNSKHPDFVLTDEVIQFDIPARISAKLEKGECTFEEFLDASHKYLTTGKVVHKGDKVPNQPNLNNSGGDSTPTKQAIELNAYEKYKTQTY